MRSWPLYSDHVSSPDLEQVTDAIAGIAGKTDGGRAMLTGISGIDASGKGHMGAMLDAELRRRGLRTALISVDSWLNLPSVRFSDSQPGLHFYENALRLDEMFEQLVLPLRADRRVRLVAQATHETAQWHHEHTYSFDKIDVVLIEGIFLFKPRFARHLDLKVWIKCGFETALWRAIARSQEGLDETETLRAYQTIYFPAQSIHLDRDHPLAAADMIIDND
jgi:uridine kinase